MPRPALTPVNDDDLDELTIFLQRNFRSKRTPAEWKSAFLQPWCRDKPNNGFMLRDGARIVGAIGAIYADRVFGEKRETVCNITSWCVLPEHRMHSLRLASALLEQKGMSFTNLTPTGTVAKSLQFFKFSPVDSRQIAVPNLPSFRSLAGRCACIDELDAVRQCLGADAAKVLEDHAHLPWVKQVALVQRDSSVHVLYKEIRSRGVRAAFVLGVSDREAFRRLFGAFAHYLLSRKGILITRLERRFLTRDLPLQRQLKRFPRKFFLSETLEQTDVDNLYSELVSMNVGGQAL